MSPIGGRYLKFRLTHGPKLNRLESNMPCHVESEMARSFSLGFNQTLIVSQDVCGCEKGFSDGEEIQAYDCDGLS